MDEITQSPPDDTMGAIADPGMVAELDLLELARRMLVEGAGSRVATSPILPGSGSALEGQLGALFWGVQPALLVDAPVNGPDGQTGIDAISTWASIRELPFVHVVRSTPAGDVETMHAAFETRIDTTASTATMSALLTGVTSVDTPALPSAPNVLETITVAVATAPAHPTAAGSGNTTAAAAAPTSAAASTTAVQQSGSIAATDGPPTEALPIGAIVADASPDGSADAVSTPLPAAPTLLAAAATFDTSDPLRAEAANVLDAGIDLARGGTAVVSTATTGAAGPGRSPPPDLSTPDLGEEAPSQVRQAPQQPPTSDPATGVTVETTAATVAAPAPTAVDQVTDPTADVSSPTARLAALTDLQAGMHADVDYGAAADGDVAYGPAGAGVPPDVEAVLLELFSTPEPLDLVAFREAFARPEPAPAATTPLDHGDHGDGRPTDHPVSEPAHLADAVHDDKADAVDRTSFHSGADDAASVLPSDLDHGSGLDLGFDHHG